MQGEYLRPQRNKQNNEKQHGEIYQIHIIDDRESDEIDQISKNDK